VALHGAFGPIARPGELAARLEARAGLVEHGLFFGLTSELIAFGPDGVERRSRRL
jgi:ribose 5-phosphate isomerase A